MNDESDIALVALFFLNRRNYIIRMVKNCPNATYNNIEAEIETCNLCIIHLYLGFSSSSIEYFTDKLQYLIAQQAFWVDVDKEIAHFEGLLMRTQRFTTDSMCVGLKQEKVLNAYGKDKWNQIAEIITHGISDFENREGKL